MYSPYPDFLFIATQANLVPRVDPPREAPMSEELWNSYKDKDGKIVEVHKVKAAIFKGVSSWITKLLNTYKYFADFR